METPLVEDSVRTPTSFLALPIRSARSSRSSTPNSSTPPTPPTPFSSPSSPFPTTPSPYTPAVPRKKRTTKRKFSIFVDSDDQRVALGSATQRSRLGFRIPLGVRTDSANSTPTPSPRAEDVPFHYAPTECIEDDKENRDPNPTVAPPQTPDLFPHNPTTPTGPPPRTPPRARMERPTRRSNPLLPPHNMVLYEMLGLYDWDVSKRVIRAAWRQTALSTHPDMATADEREAATVRMQQMNAAVEVLSHRENRHQYHIDGVLPWAG